MSEKNTQIEIVKERLKEYGEVSRNWCIRERYITRLGAIIEKLESKGWEFKTEKRLGDYIYILLKDPSKYNPEVYDPDYLSMLEKQKGGGLI